MQFGWCFDRRCECFVQVSQPFFDFRAHRNSFLDVLVLRLKDSKTVVDEGSLLELRALLARGVLGEDRIGTAVHVRVTVDGAERYRSDGTGKGLYRLIGVEFNFSHKDVVLRVIQIRH